ncbi:MAG: PHP domain-containing protein [Candidatus Zixiibacteriota bacterium]
MPDYMDMHMHTTASDGMTAPEELLRIVRESGVSAFAVTDHDTFAGSAEVRDLLGEDDPELITGVELSAGEPGEDLHLLVYLFDTPRVEASSQLAKAIAEFHRRRDSRGEAIVELLRSKGLEISLEDVKATADGSPVGRPHVADALVKNGAVKSYEEAFRTWLGYGCPGYVEKENIRPAEAVMLAHDSGGIIILAHPAINNAENEIERLVGYGLDGLEVWHPSINPSQRKRYRKLAGQYDLVISGGSDYHGREDSHGQVGQLKAPHENLALMKERARRYSQAS